MKAAVLVCTLLLIFGCASAPTPAPAPAPEAMAAPATTPAPAPAPTAAPAIETASADASSAATVIIYRPKSFFGMALRPTVMLGGADLANITNGRFYKGMFPPGHYLFQMDDKKSGADLELKAGETYYMKVEIVPGFWKGGGKMTVMANEQGSYEITQLKPLDANEVLNKTYK